MQLAYHPSFSVVYILALFPKVYEMYESNGDLVDIELTLTEYPSKWVGYSRFRVLRKQLTPSSNFNITLEARKSRLPGLMKTNYKRLLPIRKPICKI